MISEVAIWMIMNIEIFLSCPHFVILLSFLLNISFGEGWRGVFEMKLINCFIHSSRALDNFQRLFRDIMDFTNWCFPSTWLGFQGVSWSIWNLNENLWTEQGPLWGSVSSRGRPKMPPSHSCTSYLIVSYTYTNIDTQETDLDIYLLVKKVTRKELHIFIQWRVYTSKVTDLLTLNNTIYSM